MEKRVTISKKGARLIRAREAKPSVFNAARKLGELVRKVGSLLVGLTAIAYFAGWRNVSSYYDTLGAPWVLPSLSSLTFLSISAGLIVTILITTFLVVLIAEDHKVSSILLAWIAVGLVVGATAAARIPNYLPTGWLSEQTKWVFIQWGSGFMAASAGVTLVQLSVRLSDSKHKWSSGTAYLLYSALLVGLYGVPSQVGRARAEHDLNVKLTSFPLVEIVNTTAAIGSEWRLVELIGSNALLVKLSNMPGAHAFRLVPVQELTNIHYKKMEDRIV